MKPSKMSSTHVPIDAFNHPSFGNWAIDKSRPRTTQGHARQRKMERAMGIEPKRAALESL
jgi:hypothetical protein